MTDFDFHRREWKNAICFFKFIYIYAFTHKLSLVMESGHYFLVAVWKLLIAEASLVAEHQF